MGRLEATEFVLNEVEVLDQEVAVTRAAAQERDDLVPRLSSRPYVRSGGSIGASEPPVAPVVVAPPDPVTPPTDAAAIPPAPPAPPAPNPRGGP